MIEKSNTSIYQQSLTKDEKDLIQSKNDGDCIHQLFEQQVAKTPDAIAMTYEEECLTYQQLNIRANQLAHYLQTCGVGPEVLVGIYIERSIEMVVGILGTLKAGGCYVPLDPGYPQERLAFIVQDAHLEIVLTQEHLNVEYLTSGTKILLLDTQWKLIENETTENLSDVVDQTNLAYVIYTSGSTGQPKGVMMPHSAISNYMIWMQENLPLDATDRVLQKMPFSFDPSVWDVFAPLIAGATLVMAQPGGHRDSAYLVKTITEHHITILQVVPSQLQLLLEEKAFQNCQSLMRVFCGGEALSVELQERFRGCLKANLYNLYGPTETTIAATMWACKRVSGQRTVPIGRPIANMQIYLLDEHLQPVPFGEPGEIFISGPGVARGYLNRPELTAERFLHQSFSHKSDTVLYKTGDIGRYLPDQSIEFLGRVDQQVKVRGYRIELGEIETTLANHPAIRECAVLVQEFIPGDKRIVAYLVANREQIADIKEIRSFLQTRLPEYMLPSAMLLLDELPYLPNGKLDRESLPVPDMSRSHSTGTYVAPQNPIEEIISGIWSEVLRLETVGTHDTFYELGGHSLFATLVISRLREAFQVELSLHDFFASPTVAELAKIVANHERVIHFSTIRPAPSKDALPLSFSQERICFLQQLSPTNISYNNQTLLRFSGPLSIAVLERSLSEIVRRHEILRTTFPQINGSHIQLIHPAQAVKLPMTDLSSIDEDQRENTAQHLIYDEIRKPFVVYNQNYTQMPLIRWKLLRLSTTEHVLVQMESHLVSDGWSFNLFLKELLMLYRAFAEDRLSPLPELEIQFADFALWQREWMQGEAAAVQLAYWREVLAGSPPLLELPTDRPRPQKQSFQGGALRVELSESLYEALRALSRREGVTLFTTLLSAFFVLLFRYSGQEDITVGSAIANRRWRETENLIGMIVNTVALRANLSGDPSFRELLIQMHKMILDAYAHQDVPFDKVVEALQPERNLSYNPLFQAMFSFNDAPLPDLELPGLSLQMVEGINNGSAKFDLHVNFIPRAEQQIGQVSQSGTQNVTMIWEYSSDLFDESTITRMIGHFRVLLEAIVATPTRHLSQFPLLTQAEEQQLLVSWNQTQRAYPYEQCLHQLIEAQVARTPDLPAVVFEQKSLTYRELNERANQLASYLRHMGVGPDTPVSVAMERSFEMVIALLGVLKAGGAYVPFDPALPPERLAFMLEDLNATTGTCVSVLLTQSRLLPNLPEQNAHVLCLDTDWQQIALESRENLVCISSPDNLAYIIYTSGSTGKPKGAMNTHRGICNRLLWMQDAYRLTSADCVMQKTPFSFDVSIWEFFWPLITGARLVVALPDGHKDSAYLVSLIQEQQVTTLHFVPSMLQIFLEEPGLEDCSSLRQVICSGEALPYTLQERFFARHSAALHNLYGPTEAAIDVTYWPCKRNSDLPIVPIGYPIANTQIYILDPHGQPVPVGIQGELYIGGVGVARGYLNRSELTAERFIDDPFSQRPGARLYRTGDLARYQADGAIEYLGRLDHQVKLRGFRIELGEIEAVLTQHRGVHDVKVMLSEETLGDPRLVAYLLPKEGFELTREDLRGYLQTKLPHYMIPAIFVMMDAWPLTPNGKIDRNALSSPNYRELEEQQSLFIPPRNVVEVQVAQIFEEVLHVHPISMNADFFAVGGHSLSAMYLLGRLQNVFGRTLPLSLFFQGPTIEHLTSLLYEHKENIPYSPLVGIQPYGSKPTLFCIHAADGNVFDYVNFARHLGPDQPVYAIEESFLCEDLPLITTIEEMATRYIEVLYAHQPTGPYYLCGYSLGGAIAFEMARLLCEQGQVVGLLGLLDTAAPSKVSKHLLEEDDTQTITWMAEELAERQPDFSKKLLTELELRQLSIDEQWQYLLEVAIAVNYVSKQSGVEALRRQVRIHRKNIRVNMTYKPQGLYDHIITIFRAKEKTPFTSDYVDFTQGWHEFSSQPLEIHDVPGHHFIMMKEPHIQDLAEKMSRLLDEAQKKDAMLGVV